MADHLPYTCYQPGPFADIAAEPLAERIWQFLATDDNIRHMTAEIEAGQPPLGALGEQLHDQFSPLIESAPHDNERIHTMVNNMIKQLMERHGYRLCACTRLRDCPFCSSTGLYTRDCRGA